MSQEVLPSFQALKKGADSREVEEERRNCFVALTRAKRRLCIVSVNTDRDSATQRLQRTFNRLGEKITTRGAVSPPDENSVPSDE
jgi:DNA helicase-2/ATP-dependent DNA helicase PcrA